MADIFKMIIRREPDAKAGLLRRENGATLVPAGTQSQTNANLALPEKMASFGAAGRLLPHATLSALSDFLELLPSEQKPNDTDESDFATLFEKLNAAYLAKDANQIDQISSQYQASHAVHSLAEVDHVARTSYDFFKAYHEGLSEQALDAFASRLSKEEIVQHLSSAPALMSRLKVLATACMAQGTLGSHPLDLLHMMRSLVAFQAIAVHALKIDREKQSMPTKVVTELIKLDIFMAPFLFDIDPCDWAHVPKGDTSPATAQHQTSPISPLKQRLMSIEQHQLSGQAVATASVSVKTDLHTRVGDPCDCGCHEEPPCLPPDPCCTKINYYITETLVLRDRVIGYKASDLAYIENVQAWEKRQRAHSFTRTIEDFSETETIFTKSEERDHQVTERFNVQKEIESQIQMNADASASYGKKDSAYHVEINAGISKQDAQRETREEFREVVNKAVSKIQLEVRSKNSRRVTTEDKEVNTHSFKNLTAQHSVGKYFYVSKIVEGQVYGYGNRVTAELFIPSPWTLYEHLEHKKMMDGFKKPCVPDVVAPDEIDPDKYLEFKKKYCIKSLPPPPQPLQPKTSDIDFSGDGGIDGDKTYEFGQIPVPAGYIGTQIEIVRDQLGVAQDSDTTPAESNGLPDTPNKFEVEVFLGGTSAIVRYDAYGAVREDSSQFVNGVTVASATSLSVRTQNVQNFSGKLRITWTPLPLDLNPWKQQVAAAINDANANSVIKSAKQEYKKNYKENLQSRNPLVDKDIMMAEIKRAAIYMMCENFEREGVMNIKSQPCGYPEINRKKAGEKTWDWYFWDRAFDWGLMSVKFYDYFWNQMCTWPDKFDPGHPNYAFNAFLKAGYARVTIPAGPAMDHDVAWYLETKGKWGHTGAHPLNPSDPRWCSVVDEIKRGHDCYQNDREGMMTAVLNSSGKKTNQMIITGTSWYWKVVTTGTVGVLDTGGDIGRQIFIGGLAYRIQGIVQNPGTPPATVNNPPTQWLVTLDRDFEGDATQAADGSIFPQYNYAVGAEFVGAPFRWEEPTNLVWLGDIYKDDGTNTGVLVPSVGLPVYPVNG